MKNKVIWLVIGCAVLCAGCASSATRSSGTASTTLSSPAASTSASSTSVVNTATISTTVSTTPAASSVPPSSSSSSIVLSTSPSHPPSCPAQASGLVGTRRAQAVWFAAPGVQHVYPDARLVLHGCASSGLPVSFALTGDNQNCVLSGNVLTAEAPASCFVQASQAGNASYAPAIAAQQPYRLDFQPVAVAWHLPIATGGTVGQPLPITLSLTSNAPFVLYNLGIIAEPANVCTAPASNLPFQGQAQASATFTLQLLGAGNCSLRIDAGGSQFVALTSVAGQIQLSVTA
jgi:hypothetical protein